jgi:hypothetical protein
MSLPDSITLALRAVLPLLFATAALAQNDECTSAVDLVIGVPVAIDTSNATPSAEPWPCGGSSSVGDVWFRYVATTTDVLTFSTCGSSPNLVVAIYFGSCGNLQFQGCSTSSSCSFDPLLTGVLAPGLSVYLRIGSADALRGRGGRSKRTSFRPASSPHRP